MSPLLVTSASAATSGGPAAPCLTGTGTLTVEEQRIGLPLTEGGLSAAARFIRAAGFGELVYDYFRGLCAARTLDEAEQVVLDRGQRLWDLATARAQGETSLGTIDRYDDRPLYWARLEMTRALRQWEPPFELSTIQRSAYVRILDRASRGISSVAWSDGDAADDAGKRVFISGFDTYSLDTSLRNSNPSGATALQLDGRTIETDQGPVVVEAVVFPVNYTDFDQGIVEDAFGQVLVTGEDRADLIMTISQTGRGLMDIEQWAANARGGSPDNNRVMQFGPISRPSHWPQPFDSPEWIETTLPYEAMIAADTGPWPVALNDGICEWPAGTFPDPSAVRCQDDPSEGSTAAAGPGGSYLSNESMYRSNRLRIGLQAWDVPGGHLHISSLVYPTDLAALTSPAFEADRKAVVDQTIALVTAAGMAAPHGPPAAPAHPRGAAVPTTSPGDSASDAPPTSSTLRSSTRSTLVGAMFLMATSAIGPGFITQTTTFTVQLGVAFAFALAVSIVVDIALQLNTWRIIGMTGRRAQELGNLVLPGLGWAMAGLLVVGGFVFNVGNVAGAGLGTDAMLGLDPRLGGALSAVLAIGIFVSKRAGVAMDRIVVVLGAVMILLTSYVAIASGPPVGQALKNVVLPEEVSFLAITTLIGGTIGGYITYAGAHRLLDSGVQGPQYLREITRGSVIGIVITGVMRLVLFLAILGVVSGGAALDPASQAASAFEEAAGQVGLRVFGIVLWAAAITSVIGASYTSVSFLTSQRGTTERARTALVAGFIAVTTIIYLAIGTAPTTLLVFAGAFNGLFLPLGIAVLLYVAWRRADLLQGYAYPRWLLIIGGLAWLLTIYLAVRSVRPAIELVTG